MVKINCWYLPPFMRAMSAMTVDVLVTRRQQAGKVQTEGAQTEGAREGFIMKELGTTEG